MSTRVFIDGDQGTTGLQILERLHGRRDIALMQLPAALRKDPASRAEALNHCDIAILCLPDAAAREAVAMIENPAVRVIDASSAHRVAPGWVYGLPELARGQAAAIASAHRVSNPGCYPTGAVALLRPLVDAGLLPADYPLVIHAVSGYSGKGRAGVDRFEGPGAAAAPAFEVYGLALEHKHVPEIERHAALSARPVFVPAYGSFRQGIVLTIALQQRLLPAAASGPRVQATIAGHHAAVDSGHVQVLPLADAAALEGLDPQALNGSDDLRLMVFESRRSNPRDGQLLLAAVFDNLGKGAAGAAVQNLDLMLGAMSRAGHLRDQPADVR